MGIKRGGKLTFVTQWSTIFSVRESRYTWKEVLWIVIEVISVKPELPKSSSVYTYIEDQLKKLDRLIICPNDLH